MENLKIPAAIEKRNAGMSRIQHTIGMSGASVYTYYNDTESYVLKIQPEDVFSGNEVERAMLPWLYGKAPVPKVWHIEVVDNISYILMDVLPGSMANDPRWLSRGEDYMIARLAEGLKALWRVPLKGCPVKTTLNDRLETAAKRIDARRVDMNLWIEYNKFSSPQTLLQYLHETRPVSEDYVIVQGDYCMPNIFLDEQGIRGFIDLGRAGISDRYQDIGLCVRTLSHNFGFQEIAEDKRIAKLFSHLDMTPDYAKIEYFILLNELF